MGLGEICSRLQRVRWRLDSAVGLYTALHSTRSVGPQVRLLACLASAPRPANLCSNAHCPPRPRQLPLQSNVHDRNETFDVLADICIPQHTVSSSSDPHSRINSEAFGGPVQPSSLLTVCASTLAEQESLLRPILSTRILEKLYFNCSRGQDRQEQQRRSRGSAAGQDR